MELKWGSIALWPVTQRELEVAAVELVGKLESKWMLMREDVLQTLYGSLARGGTEPLLLYEQHRGQVVQVVQLVLQKL